MENSPSLIFSRGAPYPTPLAFTFKDVNLGTFFNEKNGIIVRPLKDNNVGNIIIKKFPNILPIKFLDDKIYQKLIHTFTIYAALKLVK